MVFYADKDSLKYNNMTTYGAVADNFTVDASGGIYVDGTLLPKNYKQNIYLSGIRLTPKDDFREAVSSLAFSAEKKRLDVGKKLTAALLTQALITALQRLTGTER